MTVADDAIAGASSPPAPCPCGVVDAPPWRGRDLPWSPASVVSGLVLIAVAVAAAVAGRVVWVGPALLALYLVATVAAFVALRRRGHRGGCLAGRATWIGLAAFGLPLRMVVGLAV